MKCLFLLFCLLASWPVTAQDTIEVILEKKGVIQVTTEDKAAWKDLLRYDLTRILKEVEYPKKSSKTSFKLDEDYSEQFLKKHSSSSDDDDNDWSDLNNWKVQKFLAIDFGINNYVSNGQLPNDQGEDYAVKPMGSWYIALNITRKRNIASPFSIEWSGGINWYNFKFENANIRIQELNDQVGFYDFVSGNPERSAIKSKLTASYLNITMLPLLEFGKEEENRKWFKAPSKWKIGIGVYGGYKIWSYAKAVYRDDGAKQKDKDKSGFYLNSWRYGVRLQTGFSNINFFVNYDLNPLYVDGRGPDLNAFSFGITL